MTLEIDFALMQYAITPWRSPDEPPSQPYLNSRTGAVTKAYKTVKDAMWLSSTPFENGVFCTKAEIQAENEASPGTWIPIPRLQAEILPPAESVSVADMRREEIRHIQEFLSENGIDAVLCDVATGETIDRANRPELKLYDCKPSG